MRLLRLAAALCASLTFLAASPPAKPVDVAVQTSLGSFVVRLDPAHAPVTVANFLRYVDAKTYDGATFYRTVVGYPGEAAPRIQIIQGGLEGKTDVDKLPKIPVEKTATTGLHNVAGTIAMARSNEPVSASSEFFINVGDDRVLDSDKFPDHEGYAVFGKVVRGMDVVAKIQHAPAQRNPMGAALQPAVKILRISRVR